MRVTGIATISVDGRITPPDQEGTPFASPETGVHFFAQLRDHDVSVSGRRTFDAVREMMVNALLHEEDVPKGVVWTREPEAHAADVIPGRLEFTGLEPEGIVAELEAQGHRRLLVAGGAQVYAAFAAAGLIDQWLLAVEPILLGGGGDAAVLGVCDERPGASVLTPARRRQDPAPLRRRGIGSLSPGSPFGDARFVIARARLAVSDAGCFA